MANGKDPIVGNIYETADYSKFSVIPENRGQKETGGLKERKIKSLQRMIDSGTWIHEMARVKVNKDFQVIDGAHTLEVSKRNALPIRYEITDDPHFNEVTKRDLVGNIYSINSVTTSWRAQELFEAAVHTKAPVALLIKKILEENENYFLWSDVMALLLKDGNLFAGRWRKVTMGYFERKDLIEILESNEFNLELKFFVKLNLKARIAPKKGTLLKAAYDILWYAGDMVNRSLFRKSAQSVPDNLVASTRTLTDEQCRRMMIQHYNKSQGQKVEMEAVMYALTHKDSEEAVLEIT